MHLTSPRNRPQEICPLQGPAARYCFKASEINPSNAKTSSFRPLGYKWSECVVLQCSKLQRCTLFKQERAKGMYCCLELPFQYPSFLWKVPRQVLLILSPDLPSSPSMSQDERAHAAEATKTSKMHTLCEGSELLKLSSRKVISHTQFALGNCTRTCQRNLRWFEASNGGFGCSEL